MPTLILIGGFALAVAGCSLDSGPVVFIGLGIAMLAELYLCSAD